MKRALVFIIGFLVISGCSIVNAPSERLEYEISNEHNTIASQKETQYQGNPQVTDDRSLLSVGQSYKDAKGKATLKAIKKVNETYQIGPIELTIKDMKLIHLRPDYSMIDYFHVLTHDETFDFVKVYVEFKNTSSEKVNFAPIAILKTSNGEIFDWEKDIYLEELSGGIDAYSSKEGNLGFILNTTSYDSQEDSKNAVHQEDQQISWIEIQTSNVYNKEKNKMSPSQTIKLQF